MPGRAAGCLASALPAAQRKASGRSERAVDGSGGSACSECLEEEGDIRDKTRVNGSTIGTEFAGYLIVGKSSVAGA